MKDLKWTQIVFGDLKYELNTESQKISEILKTKTVFCAHSDTDCVVVYELHQSGEKLEKMICVEGVQELDSQVRDLRLYEDVDLEELDPYEIAEEFLQEEKLNVGYVDYHTLASVGARSNLPIERLDYLEIKM